MLRVEYTQGEPRELTLCRYRVRDTDAPFAFNHQTIGCEVSSLCYRGASNRPGSTSDPQKRWLVTQDTLYAAIGKVVSFIGEPLLRRALQLRLMPHDRLMDGDYVRTQCTLMGCAANPRPRAVLPVFLLPLVLARVNARTLKAAQNVGDFHDWLNAVRQLACDMTESREERQFIDGLFAMVIESRSAWGDVGQQSIIDEAFASVKDETECPPLIVDTAMIDSDEDSSWASDDYEEEVRVVSVINETLVLQEIRAMLLENRSRTVISCKTAPDSAAQTLLNALHRLYGRPLEIVIQLQ